MKAKALAIGCGVIVSALLSTAAYSRGGGAGGGMGGGLGMHHSSSRGGSFGTSPAAPGTNALGTALSSGGSAPVGAGPALGTGDPAVDREDRKAAAMVKSICRGC